MIRRLTCLLFVLMTSIQCALAQDNMSDIVPDTVLINGDTLVMLGDSLIIRDRKSVV